MKALCLRFRIFVNVRCTQLFFQAVNEAQSLVPPSKLRFERLNLSNLKCLYQLHPSYLKLSIKLL